MRSYSFSVKSKEYWLKYDFNAICDIEEMGKKPIQSLFSEDSMGLSTIRLLIWGGLKHNDQGLTIQRAGFIIRDYLEEGGTLDELATNASKCLVYALKVEGEKQEGE